MTDYRDRATKAAMRYLELRGYEVVGQAYSPGGRVTVDIVAREEGTGDLHFVMVCKVTHGQQPFAEADRWGFRSDFEAIAACWLEDHPEDVDVAVVPDCVSLLIIGEDRALLRHYVNVPLDDPPTDE